MNIRQHQILDSVLSFVPQEGWTLQALTSGAQQAGVTKREIEKLFPRGIADVAQAFHQSIDDAMLERIKARRGFQTLRVRDKITFAVRARLEVVTPHKDALRRLLIWSLSPRHVRQATQNMWQSADLIWKQAGDTSTDYNFYTKRLLLIAVMKSTLSFWLNDSSKDYADTWGFLNRRIADVMLVGKGMSIVKTVGLSDIVSLIRSRFAA